MWPASDQQAEHLILPEGTESKHMAQITCPHMNLSHSEMQTREPCHYLPSQINIMTRLKNSWSLISDPFEKAKESN